MPDPAGCYAQLLLGKELQRKELLHLAFNVPRWPRKGKLRLKLFECDYDPKSGRLDVPTRTDLLAEFELPLRPSKADGAAWEVRKATYVQGKKRSRKTKVQPKQADLAVTLGERTFYLQVPLMLGSHDEGSTLELGWTLSDGTDTFERLGLGQGLLVPAKDWLRTVREIYRMPDGALVKRPDGKPLKNPIVPPTEKMGRFSDPHRNPSVAPDDVEAKLESMTDAALKAGGTVDVDGLRFNRFLADGVSRVDFVERFAEEGVMADAYAHTHPLWELSKRDMTMAYFIVHDVGIEAARRRKDHYTSAKITSHHRWLNGFLNHGGTYAVGRDFASPRTVGTVGEQVDSAWFKPYTINIETVPVVYDLRPQPKKKKNTKTSDEYSDDDFACVGHRRRKREGPDQFVYHWTKVSMQALADIYIHCSARAGHLLTVTTHKEVDRNLGFARVFYELSPAQLRKARGGKKKARDKPRSMHRDPFGMDMQAFYDAITARLNSHPLLGGFKLPEGVRYGIHPRRVTEADGAFGDFEKASHEHHTFPYQSNPTVLEFDAWQKAVQAWWQAWAVPKWKKNERGRNVVDSWKKGPWWEGKTGGTKRPGPPQGYE